MIRAKGERAFIITALLDHDRNITRAAEFLGISRRTLQQKMIRYELRENSMAVLRAGLVDA